VCAEERELAELQKEHRQMVKHRELLKEHYKKERAEKKQLTALLQGRDAAGQPLTLPISALSCSAFS